MLPGALRETRHSPRAGLREITPGLIFSLLLHALAAILIIYLITHSLRHPENSLIRFLPVDLVPPAERTTSAPQSAKALSPHESISRPAHKVPSSPHRTISLSPSRNLAIQDPLEVRLKQLAKLRQPESSVPHLDNGASDDIPTANNAPSGTVAGYRVTDFLRAQVERRWNLDLRHARNIVILVHVKVARDGNVTSAEIVDRARYANDATWRAIALSARNAVLLSSPLNLPAGHPPDPIDVTLVLNSKDAMH
ncbi:MAG TPA: hypothetical protein VGK90_10435 [Rhizomicrobium sp.]|jgi:hypothetical protein